MASAWSRLAGQFTGTHISEPQNRSQGTGTYETTGTPKSDAYPPHPMEPTVAVAASDVKHTTEITSSGQQGKTVSTERTALPITPLRVLFP